MAITKQRFVVEIESKENSKIQLKQLLAEEVKCGYIKKFKIEPICEKSQKN